MASWSTKRKFYYLSITLISLGIALGVPAFLLLYKAPTCSDGKMNGNEKGVDCGGSCIMLCQDNFLSASIEWSKFDEAGPNLFNLGAYISNPNLDAEAREVKYRFELFDEEGIAIVERDGEIYIPPHGNVLAFEPAVNVGERIPTRVMFRFLENPFWQKVQISPINLREKNRDVSDEESAPKLSTVFENTGLKPYGKIDVFAILFDEQKNVIGFSKTRIDSIPKDGEESAFFTWSIPRKASISSVEVIPVVIPQD